MKAWFTHYLPFLITVVHLSLHCHMLSYFAPGQRHSQNPGSTLLRKQSGTKRSSLLNMASTAGTIIPRTFQSLLKNLGKCTPRNIRGEQSGASPGSLGKASNKDRDKPGIVSWKANSLLLFLHPNIGGLLTFSWPLSHWWFLGEVISRTLTVEVMLFQWSSLSGFAHLRAALPSFPPPPPLALQNLYRITFRIQPFTCSWVARKLCQPPKESPFDPESIQTGVSSPLPCL